MSQPKEQALPDLVETSSGIFQIRLYPDRGSKFVAWLFLFVLTSSLFAPGLFLGSGCLWQTWIVIGLGAYGLLALLFCLVIFGSSVVVVDKNQRTLTRIDYVFNRKRRSRSRTVLDNDDLSVYVFPDWVNNGASHIVCLRHRKIERFLCDIHLETSKPSEELLTNLNQWAELLQIKNSGYGSLWSYLAKEHIFLIRNL